MTLAFTPPPPDCSSTASAALTSFQLELYHQIRFIEAWNCFPLSETTPHPLPALKRAPPPLPFVPCSVDDISTGSDPTLSFQIVRTTFRRIYTYQPFTVSSIRSLGTRLIGLHLTCKLRRITCPCFERSRNSLSSTTQWAAPGAVTQTEGGRKTQVIEKGQNSLGTIWQSSTLPSQGLDANSKLLAEWSSRDERRKLRSHS